MLYSSAFRTSPICAISYLASYRDFILHESAEISTRFNTRRRPEMTKPQTIPAVEGIALSFMPNFPTFKTPHQKSSHLVSSVIVWCSSCVLATD
ncbi:hypothetical protein P692DRAFT_20828858 [Suillus brevipes Sb2]|nr:hypothetical protein P692DRAFT_20828858 [Suillus brevipes Sb2]